MIPHIFVIGTASLDILHLAGRPVHTMGGAGLYTALAASRAGAVVGLFAPRPEPMPALLQLVAERLHWLGPVVAPAALSRLEIVQHGAGRATLLHASWGAEAQLAPAQLPAAVHQAAFVHIAALRTAQRQLDFLQALRTTRGECGSPRFSVGTYGRLVSGETACVHRLLAQADLFFMNEHEARGLFGSVEQASTRPDALLFVTLGAQGAMVIAGNESTHIPAYATTEVDATGAGDTFCGATLAGLARQESPVVAAERAVVLAARTVGAVGPAALLAESTGGDPHAASDPVRGAP
jgi:sugar/nucleoside kinase (ribokinase family)